MKFLRFKIYLFVFIFSFFIAHGVSAAPVYYSVGQNTTSHETGAGNVTVSGMTATFTVAQTATNMGVGDVIDYDSDHKLCYISGKTSTTVWNCVSAIGGNPAAANNVVVNSITHAFSSLNAAISGASTLLGTSNLVTGNYQLNIPCYYDTGADTTSVTLSGYTTGAGNGIKIYTPFSTTTEVNQSQRHDGKIGGSGFELAPTGNVTDITISQPYVIIEGLKIRGNSTQAYQSAIGINSASGSVIKNNLIYNWGNAAGSWNSAIATLGGGVGTFTGGQIYNNIIIAVSSISSRTRGGIEGICQYDDYTIYNNTIYGFNAANNFGISIGGDASHLKGDVQNNISINNATSFITIYAANADYNISSDASASGAHSLINKSLANMAFVSTTSGSEDLHIQGNSIAKGVGADFSGIFTIDIDGQTRHTGSWDIGADETTHSVYYSVGQNTTSHETGSGTVTVDATARTATFSVAQTATNMGVGDSVTYTGGSCYISSKTSTSVWGCQGATGGAPTAATNADVTSIAHAFNSLSAAEAGAPALLGVSDLVTGNYQLNIPCYYDTGADATAVTVDGYTTSVSNYIKIYTPNNVVMEVNASQRHTGKWDDGKYIISSNADVILQLRVGCIRIEGLQIETTKVASDYAFAISNYGTGNVADQQISNNVIKSAASSGDDRIGFYFNATGDSTTVVRFWNNIVYDFEDYGIRAWTNGTLYAHNNTIVNCGVGIQNGAGTFVSKNNIVQNCTDGYTGTFNAASNYNISDLSADAPGVNSKNSTTVSFVDATNKDFHLSPTDTAAKNQGTSLASDSALAFSTDIDNQTRPNGSAWDIGADEAANNVFYSVGQSAADLKTGTPTVTIASGTATFSTAQTGNIGVGDRVTYNTNVIAYISSKIDQSNWKVITATGNTPADISNSTVVSILHEFTSLSAAVTGASNASHINNTDLIAANVVLNFPCYYDSGADTTAVTVSGYTTGANNFIKIYTPNNTTTEANNSQRNSGKWDDGKYVLQRTQIGDAGQAAITFGWGGALNVKTEGMQVRIIGAYTGLNNSNIRAITFAGLLDDNSVIEMSNMIVRGSLSDQAKYITGVVEQETFAKITLRNSIFYGFSGGLGSNIAIRSNFGFNNLSVYNVTIQDSDIGLMSASTNTIAKNLIVQNCGTGYSGSFSALSTNNISQDNTAPGSNSKINTTVSFADAVNNDFHLSSTDTAAKGAGTSLAADSVLAFSTDIDGQERSGNWDIGADQFDSGSINSPDAGRGTESGLVGHWTFDGPTISGSTAKDVSGNNNNGTITGATFDQGKLGQALSFNGTSSDVRINNYSNTYLDFAQGTVSFWYKSGYSSFSDYPRLISYEENGDWLYCQFLDAITLRCSHQSDWGVEYDIQATVPNVNTDRAWHQVVYAWDINGGTRKLALAVDGAESINASAITDATLNDNYLHIGQGSTGGQYFNGFIDDVRIYNRALAASEITTLYKSGQATVQKNIQGNTNGLVGYWSFDGPTISGTTVTDQSGQGNNGTISGATVEQGRVGQGMGFDGIGSYINLTNGGYAMTSNFTISMWAKSLSPSSAQRLFQNGISATNGWGVGFGNTNGAFRFTKCGVVDLDINIGAWPIDWFYIAWVVGNDNDVELFVNGVSQGKYGNTQPLAERGWSNVIGSENGGVNIWNGDIDEVRIYDRALSATEVVELHNLGKVQIRK